MVLITGHTHEPLDRFLALYDRLITRNVAYRVSCPQNLPCHELMADIHVGLLKLLIGELGKEEVRLLNLQFLPIHRLPSGSHAKLVEDLFAWLYDDVGTRLVVRRGCGLPPTSLLVHLSSYLERDDMVVPFPREKHHLFGMKLMNTFNPDVVMIFTVASGEIVKAVILKHKYAVCFVPTSKAKDFVYGRLMEWLKQNRVLPPRPEIPKPDEVLRWEKDHPGDTNGSPQPADPAIVPKTLPADPAIVPNTLPANPAIVPKTLPANPAIVPKTLPADPAIVPKTLPTDPPAPTADPGTKAGVPIVKVPPMVVPKIASFGSSVL